MSIFSNFFGLRRSKAEKEAAAEAQIEEFMFYLSVYNQAYIASYVGITDQRAIPEFATYKRKMNIPSSGGKMGQAEKSHVRKLMISKYKIDEKFFREIDASVRKNCKNIRNVQGYFLTFGNFTNDLLSFLYSEYQYKLQGGLLFTSTLRSTVDKAVSKILTQTTWKTRKSTDLAAKIRSTASTLEFSQAWMAEFSYHILLQSKSRKK